MSEQVQEAQKPKMNFEQYKKALKQDVEIAELRARFAKAQFEELAANNQYNQLAYALAQAEASSQSVETPSEEATDQTEPTQDPDMVVEQP